MYTCVCVSVIKHIIGRLQIADKHSNNRDCDIGSRFLSLLCLCVHLQVESYLMEKPRGGDGDRVKVTGYKRPSLFSTPLNQPCTLFFNRCVGHSLQPVVLFASTTSSTHCFCPAYMLTLNPTSYASRRASVKTTETSKDRAAGGIHIDTQVLNQ